MTILDISVILACVFNGISCLVMIWEIRRNHLPQLKVLDFSCSWPSNEKKSREKGEWVLEGQIAIRLKNRGIPLYDPQIVLRFQGEPMSLTFRLDRIADKSLDCGTMTRGMVAEYRLIIDDEFRKDNHGFSFFTQLKDCKEQNACLIIFSQGYEIQRIQMFCFGDNLKMKWNSWASRVGLWSMKKTGDEINGVPVAKQIITIPKFIEYRAPLEHFMKDLQQMEKQAFETKPTATNG